MTRPSLAILTKTLGKANRPVLSRIEALSRTFESPEPISKREQGNLVVLIKEALSKPLQDKSSKVPVETHFLGLFEGLDALTDLRSPSKSLLSCSDEQRLQYVQKAKDSKHLIALLDELYYHRRLSKLVATAILKSPHVTDVSPFMKILNNTGSLVRWNVSTRYTFALQVANKCFSLKQIDMARSLVVGWFEASWLPLMKSAQLSPNAIHGLGRAMLALNEDELLIKDCSVWNSDTFTSQNNEIVAPFRTTVFPLLKAAMTSINRPQSVLPVLDALLQAGMRCNQEQQSNSDVYAASDVMLKFLSVVVDDLSTQKNHSGLSGTKIKVPGSLLASLDTIASTHVGKAQKNHKTHWDVMLMGQLLDTCQDLQNTGYVKELLALIEEYVSNHLELITQQGSTDVDEVHMAAVKHKLHTYQLLFG